MFLLCSTYDRIHRPNAATSESEAAANEVRVRSDELETSTTLTTCKILKMARRTRMC
jgi:hypothetical protein